MLKCQVDGCETEARYNLYIKEPEEKPVAHCCRDHLMDLLRAAGVGYSGIIEIVRTEGA